MKKYLILLLVAVVTIGITGCGNRKESEKYEISDMKSDVDTIKSQTDQISDISKEISDIKQNLQDPGESNTDEYKAQIEKLNSQIEELTTQNEQLQSQNSDGDTSYQAYVGMQFPKDGKTYVVADYHMEGLKFYSDANCSEEIKIPEFCSEKVQSAEALNTLMVYCYRTVDDKIVYSPSRPNLVDKNNPE